MTAESALATSAPFHLEATVRVLQRRPANVVDVWDRDRYRRVLCLAQGLAVIEVWNPGSIDDPEVRFSIRARHASVMRPEARRVLRRMLGLDIAPQPLQRALQSERAFAEAARALRGMRPPRFAGLFEAFANVVPFQQLSLEAGVAIVARLVAKFGEHLEHEGQRLHAFPTAQAIAEARVASLRACGLSTRKAQTLRDLARTVESGAVTEEQLAGMSTDDALRTLTELPGIGPWSAALVLLRGLGRIDVFPPGDVGAMRGLRALLRREPPAPLGEVLERFGELRGYFYFGALGASLLSKGLIHAAPD
jgi:DNA-3-methyladenine glycosylase II